MILDWFLAGLNVVLTYVLVLALGLVGAALGTALAIAIQNGVQVVLLRRFEGLWPFDVTYLKPLGAGVAMTVMMAVVKRGVAGQGRIVIGLLLGFLTYAVALYALGINPRDRLVIRELSRQYRRDVARLAS